MHIFKTSGATFDSVIQNEMHAFKGRPKNLRRGDLILVSKNKKDLGIREKQIQYVMKLKEIRGLRPGEAEKYWPGNEGRWNYLIICEGTEKLNTPFDLEDIIGYIEYGKYKPVVSFKEIESSHEANVLNFIEK